MIETNNTLIKQIIVFIIVSFFKAKHINKMYNLKRLNYSETLKCQDLKSSINLHDYLIQTGIRQKKKYQ